MITLREIRLKRAAERLQKAFETLGPSEPILAMQVSNCLTQVHTAMREHREIQEAVRRAEAA